MDVDVNIAKLADTYVKGQEHLKRIEAQQATLKKMLVQYTDEQGEPDDRGHRWLPAGEWLLQRQKRQSDPYLDRDAVTEWLQEHGLWDELKQVIEVLDEDALAGWVYEHRDDELDDGTTVQEWYDGMFITPEPTYAFMPPTKGTTYEY